MPGYFNCSMNLLRLPMSNALKHQEVIRLKEIAGRHTVISLTNCVQSRAMRCWFGFRSEGGDGQGSSVAPLDSPVLLLGETGTGKEVIANAFTIFTRKDGPFIRVNCGGHPGDPPRHRALATRKELSPGPSGKKGDALKRRIGGTDLSG